MVAEYKISSFNYLNRILVVIDNIVALMNLLFTYFWAYKFG
mgnify:CR=1 FL=1|jgi:hypothetical protein